MTEKEDSNTSARIQAAFGGDPFRIKPPTRRAFPGGIAAAIAYYDEHLATCIAAEALLTEVADHCRKLADSTEAAVRDLKKLTAAELEEYALSAGMVADLANLAGVAAPHIITFESSAREYGAQRELLERTIAALKAAL